MQSLDPSTVIGGDKVYRNQLVKQDKGDWKKDYVVTDVGPDYVKLNDPDFDGPAFTVDEDEWVEDGYEPATAINDDPVWGY